MLVTLSPNISFKSISGGQWFISGVRSDGYSLLCWNTFSLNNDSTTAIFIPKRIYFSASTMLLNVSVGDNQICSTTNDFGTVRCWKGGEWNLPQLQDGGNRFAAITSGFEFSHGIVVNGSVIR
ncbi:Putative serine/threonine-protein kinase-like protein CCR3 [Linum perenne]